VKKLGLLILGVIFAIPLLLVGCGNGDNAANDIGNLFNDVMPDGLEITTDDSFGNGDNGNYGAYDGVGDGDPYKMYGNYGANTEDYQYNNNYNNVYGTAPGDFNRVGYNNSGKGNMDFDMTPSNFDSEKNT